MAKKQMTSENFVGYIVVIICLLPIVLIYLIFCLIKKIFTHNKNKDINIQKEENSSMFNDDNGLTPYQIFDLMDDEEENVSGYTDEEMDNLGLEPWQKELVKKGEYDISSFDEEDLEDDDLYSEDPF